MPNFKEIAKENKFIKNAARIKEIAKDEYDVGIALDMYCAEKGIKYFPYAEKQREFLELCRKYTLDKIVEELK